MEMESSGFARNALVGCKEDAVKRAGMKAPHEFAPASSVKKRMPKP